MGDVICASLSEVGMLPEGLAMRSQPFGESVDSPLIRPIYGVHTEYVVPKCTRGGRDHG